MFGFKYRVARVGGGIALAGALAIGIIAPAAAENAVTLNITGGSYSASVADAALTAVNYSHSDQNQTGSMTLTADDSTGTGAGWNVTIQSSDFAYSGTSTGGSAIPAANFAITTANAPSASAGQVIDPTNGPMVPAAGATGTLDQARKVLQAAPDYGLGTYTQALDVQLAIPGMARAGTYTGTLTVTISAGPGA